MKKQKIKEIASKLYKDNSTFTRADLAYELKINDSVEVERLVYETYLSSNKDKAIKDSFITNDGSKKLIDAYKIAAELTQNQQSDAIDIIKDNLDITDQQIQALNRILELALNNESGKKNAGLLDYISGSAGIKNVQCEASDIFDKYSQLIDSYIESKSCVNNDIADFTDLRSNIIMIFLKYSTSLVDIFGDSIKIIDPQLFDFDKIQYLDVSAMLRNIELEYKHIADKCPILIDEIYDSFKHNFSKSINTISSTSSQDNKLALIDAGISFLNHYIDSSQRTSILRQDLSNFKISVKKDITNIKGDMSRLFVIHKTLNDLYIPKANTFYRYCENIFSDELEKIINSIYKSPKVKELKQERDEIIVKHEALLRTISDHKESIVLYESLIEEISSQLNSQQVNYNNAMREKPKKPILCFGPMKEKYYRELSDWDCYYAPMVNNYNNMLIELNLSKKELSSHKKGLESSSIEQKECSKSLNKISKEIMKIISVDDITKAKIIKHLKPIIGLLNIAKEIIQSKLDDRLVMTVEIRNIDTLALTPQLENKIDSFTDELAKNLVVNSSDIDGVEFNEEEAEQLSENINDSIQKGATALNTLLKLQEQLSHEKISLEEYDKQLNSIQNYFMNDIKSIDRKGEYLREIVSRVNTAKNNDELKNALLELTDNQINISDKEFNLFLEGKKTIEI